MVKRKNASAHTMMKTIFAEREAKELTLKTSFYDDCTTSNTSSDDKLKKNYFTGSP
jgi:hypothetical protein